MPFPTYKAKTDIPAGAEDVYEEKEGQWVPKLPDVTTLEGTLTKVRTEKKEAETKLKTLETERDTAVRERDALKTQVGDPETKTKALLDKFDADLKKAVEAKDAEIATLTGKLRTVTLDDSAKAAFIKAGGRPERADAALKLARENLDLVEDRIVIKDDKGAVTTTTVEDFFGKTFRTNMPELFSGTKAAGGGAAGGKLGSGAGGALTAEDLLKNPTLAFEAANAQAAATT